jgi:hypothetical protein
MNTKKNKFWKASRLSSLGGKRNDTADEMHSVNALHSCPLVLCDFHGATGNQEYHARADRRALSFLRFCRCINNEFSLTYDIRFTSSDNIYVDHVHVLHRQMFGIYDLFMAKLNFFLWYIVNCFLRKKTNLFYVLYSSYI